MKCRLLFALVFGIFISAIVSTSTVLADYDRTRVLEGYVLPDATYKKAEAAFKLSDGEHINPATGDLEIKETDLVLKGKNGLDLAITRYYRLGDSNLKEPYVGMAYDNVITNYYQVKAVYDIHYFDLNYNEIGVDTGVEITDPQQFTDLASAQALLTDIRNGEYSGPYLEEDDYGNPYYEYYVYKTGYIANGTTSSKRYFYATRPGMITCNEKYFDIGAGWSFDFPYIEDKRGILQLHYGSAGVWHIKVDPVTKNLSLDGYDLKDITISHDNTYTRNEEMVSEYVVTEKSGKKSYFGKDGRLLAIEDRFGNSIKFYHTTYTGRVRQDIYNDGTTDIIKTIETPVVNRIVDSLNREVKIDYGTDNTITVSYGSKRIVYYRKQVKDITSPSTSKEASRHENEYVLWKVVDSEDNVTEYQYDINYSLANYLNRNQAHYNDYDKESTGAPKLDANGNPIYSKPDNDPTSHQFRGIYNYYACLSKIIYPTMAETCFEYNDGVRYYPKDDSNWEDYTGSRVADRNVKNLGPDGSIYFYKVVQRYEKDKAGNIYNKKDFTGIKSKVPQTNVYVQYDGYPYYKAEGQIPDTYEMTAKVIDGIGNSETYTYNKKLLTKRMLFLAGDNKSKKETIYNYDENKQLTLKADIVTDPSTNEFIVSAENYEYDVFRNLTGYWDTQADRVAYSRTSAGSITIDDFVPLSDEHKTSYTYNPVYYYLASEEYKKDADTHIRKVYTPSADNKTIDLAQVYEKAVGAADYKLKKKAQLIYDSFGNITEERNYLDGWTEYVSIFYSFDDNDSSRDSGLSFDGAYLTSKWYDGVADADGNLVDGTEWDQPGKIVEKYYYDYYGDIVQSIDGKNYSTYYQYDDLGRITKITNPDNSYKTWKYTSDSTENSVEAIAENGSKKKTVYDEFGNPKNEQVFTKDDTTGAEGYKSINNIVYDSVFRVDREDNSINGGYTKYAYYTDGRLMSKEVKDGKGTSATGDDELVYKESYIYDDACYVDGGKFHAQTKTVEGDADAPSIVTASYTDKDGLLRKQARLHNGTEYKDTYNYDYIGNKTDELVARFYDEKDAYIYDDTQTTWVDPVTNDYYKWTTKYTYDFEGKRVRTDTIEGNFTTTKYDALGRAVQVTDFKGNKEAVPYYTEKTYDNMGRLVKEQIPFEKTSGGTIYKTVKKYGYDANSNKTYEKVTTNKPGDAQTFYEVYFVYNSRNLLTATKNINNTLNGPHETWARYRYDASGNKIRMYTGLQTNPFEVDEDGIDSINGNEKYNITKYIYNKYTNMLEKVIDPMNYEETFEYDLLGNLKQHVDKNSNIISYDYDVLNRVKTKSVESPDVSADASYSYTYTLTGNKRTVSGGGVNYTYTYDDLGRLVTETESTGITKEYGYDASDNRTSFVLMKDGISTMILTYVYDNMNRLEEMYEHNGQTKLLAEYVYDENGNREMLKYASEKYVIDYDYNLVNKLTSLVNKKDGITISNYSYTYYLNGSQASKSESISGRLSEYVYDGCGRLYKEIEKESGTPRSTITYTYDDSHNRKTMTVESDGTTSITSYNYDYNNRLVDESKYSNGQEEKTYYEYDKNGNLVFKKIVHVTVDNQGSTPSFTTFTAGVSEDEVYYYRYDGFNQMTGYTGNGHEVTYSYDGNGMRTSKTVDGVKTSAIWDGQNIVLELNNSNGIKSKYLRGINLIATYDAYNAEKFYMFNGHGDVVHLLGDNYRKDYEYDAFGNEKNKDPGDVNLFRYCGEYWDEETGTYYLRARYYDPAIGRFISADTFTGHADDPLSLNLYTYCGNNPVLLIDSDGHFWHIAAGALIGGVVNTVAQIASDVVTGQEITLSKCGAAFLSGAAVGGLAAATGGVSLLASSAVDAVVYNVAKAGIETIQTGENQFGWRTVTDTGIGFASNLAAGKLGNMVLNKTPIKGMMTKATDRIIKSTGIKNFMKSAYSKQFNNFRNFGTRVQTYNFAKNWNFNVNKGMNIRGLNNAIGEGFDRLAYNFSDDLVNPVKFTASAVSKFPYNDMTYTVIDFGVDTAKAGYNRVYEGYADFHNALYDYYYGRYGLPGY